MHEGDEITLRPRLTINQDLHPELFEVFSRLPANRQNAMVMQMLIRMATIDHHGLGAIPRENRTAKTSRLTQAPEKTQKVTDEEEIKHVQTQKLNPVVVAGAFTHSSATEPLSEEVNTQALKDAVGLMFTQ